MNTLSLCGREVCRRLCLRSCHCELGRARAAWLLQLRRQRCIQKQQDQQARWRAVGHAIEANVIRNAGSFEAFQLQLLHERQKKAKEVSC